MGKSSNTVSATESEQGLGRSRCSAQKVSREIWCKEVGSPTHQQEHSSLNSQVQLEVLVK